GCADDTGGDGRQAARGTGAAGRRRGHGTPTGELAMRRTALGAVALCMAGGAAAALAGNPPAIVVGGIEPDNLLPSAAAAPADFPPPDKLALPLPQPAAPTLAA